MPKKIKVDLSTSELKRLERELEQYKSGIIQKIKLLVKKLAEIGVEVAKANIDKSPLGHYITLQTDITEEQAGCKAILIAIGETIESDEYNPFNTLLAVEFGAGIHYNPEPNPKSKELGYGVGTFPGQVHAFEDGWYYWDEELQKWRYSHGVKATMPMISASIEMQNSIAKAVKEVFR